MQPETPLAPLSSISPSPSPMGRGPGGGATPQPERTNYASPGVTTNRKIATGLFLALLAAFTIFVAAEQGASVVVSTVIGFLFILGFIVYLKIIAPPPFRITLSAEGLQREEQGMEQILITWPNLAKVKEDRFPNGLSVSLAIYKRVGAKGLHRSFIVYRDDLPSFDDLLADLKRHAPPETRWNIDTVHE